MLRSQAFEKLTTGAFDSAVKIYNAILEIDSKDSSAHLFRGLAYQGMKKFPEAETDFKKVLEDYPDKVDAIILLGNLYSEMGDDKKTAENYDKAGKIDPSNPLVPIYKAAFYLKSKDPDRAIVELEKVQKLRPDFESLQTFFGEAYFQKGEFETAMIYLKTAVEKNNGDQKAWLVSGSILASNGDKAGACNAFEEAVRSNSISAADSLKKYCR